MTERRCARTNLPVLISLCLSLATILLSAKGAEFSHERDLPPLTLAATELDNVLRKAQSLIAAANGPPGEQDYSIREVLSLAYAARRSRYLTSPLRAALRFPRLFSGFLTP